MADQAGRHRRREQHRIAARFDGTPAEPSHRPPRGFLADVDVIFEILVVAGDGVPVVLLHAVLVGGNQRAAHRVARSPGRFDEAVRVAVDVAGALGGNLGAFGIDDALVEGQGCGLGLQGELGGLLDVHRPRMVQVELGQRRRHQLGIGEAIAGVFAGVLGDVQRRTDRLAHGVRAVVGCVRAALALADVDGDAEATVVVELHRLQLALAHRHAKASVVASRHFGGACALALGFVQNRRHQRLQAFRPLRRIVGEERRATALLHRLAHCAATRCQSERRLRSFAVARSHASPSAKRSFFHSTASVFR